MTCPFCGAAHTLSQCPRWRVRPDKSKGEAMKAILILLALLAGCGGGGDDPPEVTTQPVRCADNPRACL
jgi:hypothetical protein